MGNPIVGKYEQADADWVQIGTDALGNDIYPLDEVLDLDGTLINLEHVTMDELVDFLIGYQDARKYRIEK